jgi:hypothetical protein
LAYQDHKINQARFDEEQRQKEDARLIQEPEDRDRTDRLAMLRDCYSAKDKGAHARGQAALRYADLYLDQVKRGGEKARKAWEADRKAVEEESKSIDWFV